MLTLSTSWQCWFLQTCSDFHLPDLTISTSFVLDYESGSFAANPFSEFINQNPELMAGIFWLPKTEIRNRDLGNKKSEIRNQKSESGKRKTEIRNQKSEIRNQKSEIRNPKSEIGNRKSEIRNRNQKSEIRNQKSKIRLSKGTWRDVITLQPSSRDHDKKPILRLTWSVWFSSIWFLF